MRWPTTSGISSNRSSVSSRPTTDAVISTKIHGPPIPIQDALHLWRNFGLNEVIHHHAILAMARHTDMVAAFVLEHHQLDGRLLDIRSHLGITAGIADHHILTAPAEPATAQIHAVAIEGIAEAQWGAGGEIGVEIDGHRGYGGDRKVLHEHAIRVIAVQGFGVIGGDNAASDVAVDERRGASDETGQQHITSGLRGLDASEPCTDISKSRVLGHRPSVSGAWAALRDRKPRETRLRSSWSPQKNHVPDAV